MMIASGIAAPLGAIVLGASDGWMGPKVERSRIYRVDEDGSWRHGTTES